MRILFLLQGSIYKCFGGAELQVDYICKACEKSKYEVHYAFDSNRDLKILNRKLSFHFLHDYGSKMLCWLNFFSIGNLINRLNPDIIFQRCRFAYTGIAAYYAKKYSIPMIYHVSSDKDCLKNKISVNKAYIPNMINEYLGRYGIKNADFIIAQTRVQQELLKKNYNRKSIIVSGGQPVPRPPYKKANPPIVAWISNIKKLKQPEVFIELAERLQYTNAQFIYAGRLVDSEYKKTLIESTRKLPNLKYLGEISFEETNELLSKSSILVNTSPREGFPNTYVQAWMRETPVVALSHNPDNLLTEKKIGFHSRSFEQLVKDVRYLIENENARNEMGRIARKYAVENHGIEKIGKRYLEVFEDLVKNR